jgi:hypothetical protein
MPKYRIEAIERFLVRTSYVVVADNDAGAKRKIEEGKMPFKLEQILAPSDMPDPTSGTSIVEWHSIEIVANEQFKVEGFSTIDQFIDALPESPSMEYDNTAIAKTRMIGSCRREQATPSIADPVGAIVGTYRTSQQVQAGRARLPSSFCPCHCEPSSRWQAGSLPHAVRRFGSITPERSMSRETCAEILYQALHQVSRSSTSYEADAQAAICAESSPWLCPWRARR